MGVDVRTGSIGPDNVVATDGLLGGFRAVAGVVLLLIVAQAALAGQGLYGGQLDLIAVHGWVGNGSYLLAIVMAGVGLLGVRRGWGWMPAGLAVLLVALMTAQLGFGYMGRRLNWANALHIPNGVLLTAVAAALLAVALLLRPVVARERR